MRPAFTMAQVGVYVNLLVGFCSTVFCRIGGGVRTETRGTAGAGGSPTTDTTQGTSVPTAETGTGDTESPATSGRGTEKGTAF